MSEHNQMVTDAMVEAFITKGSTATGTPSERIRACLEAALAAAWQPIETADGEQMKDGPHLIGARGRVGVAEWLPNLGLFMSDDLFKPTHWMPMPAPPNEG